MSRGVVNTRVITRVVTLMSFTQTSHSIRVFPVPPVKDSTKKPVVCRLGRVIDECLTEREGGAIGQILGIGAADRGSRQVVQFEEVVHWFAFLEDALDGKVIGEYWRRCKREN